MNNTESSSQGADYYFFSSTEDSGISEPTAFTLGEGVNNLTGDTVTVG